MIFLGRYLPVSAEKDAEPQPYLGTCPETARISAGGTRVGSLLEPHTVFPLKPPSWALVGLHILPAAVGQADPQRCLLVRREWADPVHLRELR